MLLPSVWEPWCVQGIAVGMEGGQRAWHSGRNGQDWGEGGEESMTLAQAAGAWMWLGVGGEAG